MAAARKDDGSTSRIHHPDRRRLDRVEMLVPLDASDASGDEVQRLKRLLAFSARQMADLRSRNEQLMAVNSDLRCKLGEMTLRWVDLSNRVGR
jgi:hypothetical protein